MDPDKILAMDDKDASCGELAHTIRAAQLVIHELCNVTQKVQITGRLRHLDYNGHRSIELLTIPVFINNLVDEPTADTYLHERLHELISNWDCPDPPTYRWTGPFYRYSLTTVSSVSELTIAQLIHTGPLEFAEWLSKENNQNPGALPWAYHITDDYKLIDNNQQHLDLLDEKDFFHAIGYQYIEIEDRNDGNPQFWKQFKLPVA